MPINIKEFKEKEILQSVVIANDFSRELQPLTSTTSSLLIPFANVPLIEFVLESLVRSNVEETFIFCCRYGDQVSSYINQSRWKSNRKMKINIIISDKCSSLGDALRDIDNKALIRGDFILLYGDCLFNVDLELVISEHKAIKLKDKDSVLTVLLQNCPKKSPLRNLENNMILEMEGSSLIHLNKIYPHKTMPEDEIEELLSKVSDLISSEVYICTPNILALMSDNFDFQTMHDLMKGIIDNKELLGHNIHCHLLDDRCYVARVSNLKMFNIVRMDFMNKLLYPLVLESCFTNSFDDVYSYNINKNNYLHFQLPSSFINYIGNNVIIGKGSILKICEENPEPTINNCSVGRGCFLGKGVSIEDSTLFDGVKVGDDCRLRGLLVAEGVEIGKGFKLENTESKPLVLTSCRLSKNSKEHSEKCFQFIKDEEEIIKVKLGSDNEGNSEKEEEEEDDDDDSLYGDMLVDKILSFDLDSDEKINKEMEEEKSFYKELIKNLNSALKNNTDPPNVILEINSTKHAYGVPINKLNKLLIKAILFLALDSGGSSSFFPILKKQLKTFLPILLNYTKSNQAQRDILQECEILCCKNKIILNNIQKILYNFYDNDVLSENAILIWWSDRIHREEDLFNKTLQPFIDWLDKEDEDDE